MRRDTVLIEKLKNDSLAGFLYNLFSELELQSYWLGVDLENSAKTLDKLFRGNH